MASVRVDMAKSKGARNTLLDDPVVARVKRVLGERGYANWSEAARAVGFEVSYFLRLVHRGLPSRPSLSTVERLDKLGITALVRRK
jgi:hypothetical protein